MKELKISLVVIVIVAIGVGIFFGIQSITDPPAQKDSENQFISKIEQEIDELKAKPDNKFCRDFYNEIAYHIDDFFQQNRFGSNQSDNDQWKEILEKNLYSAYTEKFIKQAKTVFSGSEWNTNDLQFIQAEKNELRNSRLLVVGSPVDIEFTNIQMALNKYNEIVSFISSCRGYNYSITELSARFPIADMQNKISRAAELSSNHLENDYVNNCTLLHDDLIEIPSILFRAHVNYLDNKISYWSDMYSVGFTSQKDYANNLYRPLRSEIEALDNEIYNVANFDSEYDNLSNKWNADNVKAYNYDYKQKK